MDPAVFALPALRVLPFPVFIVDDDVRILAMNESAARLVGPGAATVLHKRGGEALHCVHHADTPEGCGHGPACADCVVRTSVNAAFAGQCLVHQRAKLELRHGDKVSEVFVLVTASPFVADGKAYTALVLEDLTEVMAAGGILPVCVGCKKIRQDGQWLQLEQYLNVAMDMKVSHGICPSCLKEMYPEFSEDGPGAPNAGGR
jgi:hypothetical protein